MKLRLYGSIYSYQFTKYIIIQMSFTIDLKIKNNIKLCHINQNNAI